MWTPSLFLLLFVLTGFLVFLFYCCCKSSTRKSQPASQSVPEIPQAIQEKLKQESLKANPLPFAENPWHDSAFSKRYTCYVDENEIWGSGKAEVQKIIRLFPRPNLQILDLGCGTGRHAYFLSEAGHSVVGLDQCVEAITRAKKRNYAVPTEFFCTSVLAFQTRQRFDLVLLLCALALNLSGEQLRAWIRFSMNLLKPGGSMLIDLPDKMPPEEAYFFLDQRPLWNEKPCWIFHRCQPDFNKRQVLDQFFCCSLDGQLLPHHTVSRQYHLVSEIQHISSSEGFSPQDFRVIPPDSPTPPLHTPWILLLKK